VSPAVDGCGSVKQDLTTSDTIDTFEFDSYGVKIADVNGTGTRSTFISPVFIELKTAEVPPGPPVLSTLMAEIYGPDAETRREAARRVRQAFEAVDFVVDVDDSFGTPPERLRIEIEQESLEYHGVQEQALYDTLEALLGGVRVGSERVWILMETKITIPLLL
jgi:multidrug efflux pump subunit AcrB